MLARTCMKLADPALMEVNPIVRDRHHDQIEQPVVRTCKLAKQNGGAQVASSKHESVSDGVMRLYCDGLLVLCSIDRQSSPINISTIKFMYLLSQE